MDFSDGVQSLMSINLEDPPFGLQMLIKPIIDHLLLLV